MAGAPDGLKKQAVEAVPKSAGEENREVKVDSNEEATLVQSVANDAASNPTPGPTAVPTTSPTLPPNAPPCVVTGDGKTFASKLEICLSQVKPTDTKTIKQI